MKKLVSIMVAIAMCATLMPIMAASAATTHNTTGVPTFARPANTASPAPIEARDFRDAENITLPVARTNSAKLDAFGNGIALLLENSVAFSNGRLNFIDENPSVTPIVVDNRTLVPVRFIAETFGADVEWDEEARTVGITLDGAEILITIDSRVMVVNGENTMLDVAAQIIEERTMLPFRAFAEAIGKQVFWDNRGLILITDNEIDAGADTILVDTMLGYLRTFRVRDNVNLAPRLSPDTLNFAFQTTLSSFSSADDAGGAWGGIRSVTSMFYLSLAAFIDPTTASDRGVLAADRAAAHLRNIVAGGNEYYFDIGPWPQLSLLPDAILMARMTPAVWNQLTPAEVERVDLLMEAAFIAMNWGFNDANNFDTGFGRTGNFNKNWNPNFRVKGLIGLPAIVMYFDNDIDRMNAMLTGFDYDDFFARLEAARFTNLIGRWSRTDREIMMNGGAMTLENGTAAGQGAGVRREFVYMGMGLDDLEGIVHELMTFTFGIEVQDGWQGRLASGEDTSYTVSGNSSPWLGYMGAFTEFDSTDGGGFRSDANYAWASWQVIVPAMINVNMFLDGWDGTSAQQREVAERFYIGTEDFLFKMYEGFNGWAIAAPRHVRHDSFNSVSYGLIRNLWDSVLAFRFEADHGDDREGNVIPVAPPMGGIVAPPPEALISTQFVGGFQSIYQLNQAYTGIVDVEFDLIFGPDMTDLFDGVVGLGEFGRESATYAQLNILIQFARTTINVRYGPRYIDSNVPALANFRYRLRLQIDVDNGRYTVWATPIWPTAGAEVLLLANAEFRTGAEEILDIGSIMLTFEDAHPAGMYWIENVVVNGEAQTFDN